MQQKVSWGDHKVLDSDCVLCYPLTNLGESLLSALSNGQMQLAVSGSPTAAGTATGYVIMQSSAALVSLWVPSLTSGSVTLAVYDMLGPIGERLLTTFTAVTVATAEPVVWEATSINQRLKFVVTTTGACEFYVYVRAVAPASGGAGGGAGYFPSGW